MKKPALFTIFSLLFVSFSFAQNFAANKQQIRIAKPLSCLEAGEELCYRVEWLGLPVGRISIKNEGIRQFRGQPCYYLTAQAYPNKFLSNFFNIRYSVESYLNRDSLCSLQFVKDRVIDGQRSRVVIQLFPETNSAVFAASGSSPSFKISALRSKIEKDYPATRKIPARTQDLLSSFYYFRLQDVNSSQGVPINIYYNQRNFPLKMFVSQPFVREVRRKGAFPVFRIFPDSSINEYILGGRKFEVYLTADSRRIPIEFRLSTSLGSMRAIIEDVPQ